MKNNDRLCIYPNEATVILERTEKHTYKIFQSIRDCYGLKANQYVSISLSASYTSLPEKEIRKLLL
ncbi:hypothetical protein [Sphingobacterium anhuiense]|uniref:hypothetical protein n=1 Tax=Sphingobacterium anhuiense TaxID=493780 RepID=UPI003C2FE18B